MKCGSYGRCCLKLAHGLRTICAAVSFESECAQLYQGSPPNLQERWSDGWFDLAMRWASGDCPGSRVQATLCRGVADGDSSCRVLADLPARVLRRAPIR